MQRGREEGKHDGPLGCSVGQRSQVRRQSPAAPSPLRRSVDSTVMRLPRAVVLDPSDNGPGLVRALRRSGVPVTLLATPTFPWAACGCGFDGRVLGRLPEEGESWLKVLREIAAAGTGVLMPASDDACDFVARERARIPSVLRSFESAGSSHLELMDKARLYALADRSDIAYPATHVVTSRAEIESVGRDAAFPLLMKPALTHRWRHLFGNRRAFLVDDLRALRAVAMPAVDAGLAVLMSEYVPGPVTNIESALIIRRDDGSLPLAYTKRKLSEYPELGAGTIHETVNLPDTLELARRLLEEAGFVGLATVETKRDERTGQPVLIEANLRLSQAFDLGEAAGVDASWRLYATLAGIPVSPQPAPRQGARLVVATLEVRRVLALLVSRRLAVRQLLASYRGARSVSGFDIRDPGPILCFVRYYARRAAEKAAGALLASLLGAGGPSHLPLPASGRCAPGCRPMR